VLAAFAFAGAASALAWIAAGVGLSEARSLGGEAEPPPVLQAAWFDGVASPSLALAGTLVLVWVQAFGEEVGWRGYFLRRAMDRFGRWRGLVLQGVAWGTWYAPVLFFSTFGSSLTLASASRSLGFMLTCIPLGTLFGWLRLASKSVVPVITANTTLTLIAGLPYVLHGLDAGLRSAIFGPPGWPVLAGGVGALLGSRWRFAVSVPERDARAVRRGIDEPSRTEEAGGDGPASHHDLH
jgi:membrane protease YdiL (CAAX protease family)